MIKHHSKDSDVRLKMKFWKQDGVCTWWILLCLIEMVWKARNFAFRTILIWLPPSKRFILSAMNNLSKFILISSRSRRIKLFNLFSAEFFLELHLLAASEKLYFLEEFQNLYMGWYLFIFAHNWYWFSSKFVLSVTILFCYESPIMTVRYFASLQDYEMMDYIATDILLWIAYNDRSILRKSAGTMKWWIILLLYWYPS